MITPELFNRNDALRTRLAEFIDVFELASQAANHEIDNELQSAEKHDALEYSMCYAQKKAIANFINKIRLLARVAPETIGPLEASYGGIDAFEQIRIDAEREEAESRKPKAAKRKK